MRCAMTVPSVSRNDQVMASQDAPVTPTAPRGRAESGSRSRAGPTAALAD
jgi:hypothetical protein